MQVEGSFDAQDAVRICDADGREVGRALVNYNATDVCKVKVPILICTLTHGLMKSFSQALVNYNATDARTVKVTSEVSCFANAWICTRNSVAFWW